jgi:hypothetical protein
MLEGSNSTRRSSLRKQNRTNTKPLEKQMKINSDLTKTLLEIATKAALNKFPDLGNPASQNTPEDTDKSAGAGAESHRADGPTEAQEKDDSHTQPQEPFSQMVKGIGMQVAAAVTEGLSRQMDKKVEDTVQKAEIAIERQRIAAISEMQAVIEIECTKAAEELRKTAASISNKVLLSAALVGGSLLMVATALFLHK